MILDRENIDEITTTTAVGGGLKKDTLPNREKGKGRNKNDRNKCYCPVCKEPREKTDDNKSCCELTCPECNSVLTARNDK